MDSASSSKDTSSPSQPIQDERNVLTYKTTKLGYEQIPLHAMWNMVRNLDNNAHLLSSLKDLQTQRIHLVTWTQAHNDAKSLKGNVVVLEIWYDDPASEGTVTKTSAIGDFPKLWTYLEDKKTVRGWYEYAVVSQAKADEMMEAIMKGDFE